MARKEEACVAEPGVDTGIWQTERWSNGQGQILGERRIFYSKCTGKSLERFKQKCGTI